MAKVSRNPAIDPLLPKAELEIDGVSYHLAFTFEALALAEGNLHKQGIVVNLLHALDLSSLNASQVPQLLYAALISHDPAITYDKAVSLVTLKNLPAVLGAIANAYSESLSEPEQDKKDLPLDQQPK